MQETNLNEEQLKQFLDLDSKITRDKFTSYVGNVERGSNFDVRTPFYKTGKQYPERSEVLNLWRPTLEALKDELPGLYKYENDMAEKVGPMSVMAPLNDRWEDIYSYFEAIHSPQQPVSDEAVKQVINELNRVKGVRMLNQANTLAAMDLGKAAGAPFLGKKRDHVDQTIPCDLLFSTKDLTVVAQQSTKWKSCAMLGWRGQEGGPTPDDTKQRVIWMFPFAISILELQMYIALIRACQRAEFNPAWISQDAVDMRMTQLMKTKGRNDEIVCTDFTKFDQHFNATMQEAAKSVIAGIVSPGENERDWLREIYPVKYQIPLLAGKTLITGLHGVASGSGGTNWDETAAHRALQYEAASAAGSQLNRNSMCSGDDGCLSYPGISVEQVTESYTSHGLDMNETKQDHSVREATYLRRWYDIEYRKDGLCRGVYATTRAIGRLLAQEREYDPKHWGPKLVTLRYLSIIENCKYHPLFDKFVEFCIKGDKYRLGLDIPGFYDNLESIVKESMHMIPEFMSYNQRMQMLGPGGRVKPLTGIMSWSVVQYILSNYSSQVKHSSKHVILS